MYTFYKHLLEPKQILLLQADSYYISYIVYLSYCNQKYYFKFRIFLIMN